MLILASQSPQRSELLKQIHVPHNAIPANIDETPQKNELPDHLALRLAREKAIAVASKFPDKPILAADTLVCLGRSIAPKPQSPQEATLTLQRLSGRRHLVIGGVCLIVPSPSDDTPKISVRRVVSSVAFKRLTEQEIALHTDLMEWQDRAGGYAIQGLAASFVRFLSGSYSNVVGLPLFETAQLLKGNGLL